MSWATQGEPDQKVMSSPIPCSRASVYPRNAAATSKIAMPSDLNNVMSSALSRRGR